ncbi:LysR family transcriptional regulator [Paraburkholderia sediminicola]|uniref:LysR family transcriptional regulator n=1 Tax=Paraburkholderia sediminicola TaxID=458836 RepID=UPI0038BC35DB
MQDTKQLVGRLKLRHLSVIHAIGRAGSLQKASEQLALSQSAVSKTLTEAEALLGAQLFERTPFGSRATLLGEVLIRYSARVMTDLERAGDECDALLKGEAGTLTMGVFTPVGIWASLSQCVNDFQTLSPRVRLTLRQGSMEQLLPALVAEELDLVIGRWKNVDTHESLHFEPLFYDGGPVFVARAEHPLAGRAVTLDEMVAFPWFLPEAPSMLLATLRNILDAIGLPLPNRVTYSDVHSINLAICAQTDMITFQPSLAINEVGALYGLRKINFALPFDTVPLSAIWRKDRPVGAVAGKFVAQLKTICEGSARSGHAMSDLQTDRES